MCAVWGHNYCKLQSSDALLICCLVLRDARRMSDLQASVKNTLSGCGYGMRACVCVCVSMIHLPGTWLQFRLRACAGHINSIDQIRLFIATDWGTIHAILICKTLSNLCEYICDVDIVNIHIENWHLTSWLIKIFIHNKSSGKMLHVLRFHELPQSEHFAQESLRKRACK